MTKPYLTLELSSFCNLKCSFCSQHNPDLDNSSFMDFKTFKSIIDDILNSNLKFYGLNLFFRGESLLNPWFEDMMNYLYEYPICEYIVLHTNGLLLNRKNREAILKICDQRRLPHPGNLVISMDSASKHTYKKIRGGDFDLLIDNIRSLLIERAKKKQWGPNVIFQFIIMEDNKHEVIDFYNIISGLCIKNSHKDLFVVSSIDNKPFKIKGDMIYYRQLEGNPLQNIKNKKLYKDTIEFIKKQITLIEY